MHSNQSREYLSTCRNSQLFILILIKFFIRDNQKYKEAEQFYTKAKLLDEHNSNIFCDFGECLRQQMQIEKALIEFDQALRIDANYPQAAFYKGYKEQYLQGFFSFTKEYGEYQQRGKMKNQQKKKSLNIFKILHFLRMILMQVYSKLCFQRMLNLFTMISLDGFPDDAQQIIEEILIITPNNYEGLLLKSFMLFGKQQFGLSLQLLGQTIIQDQFVVFFKSLCLFSLEQYNDAIKLLDSILEFDSNNQNVQLIKGQCLMELKQHKEASAIFCSILESNPDYLIAQQYKGIKSHNYKINVQKYINIIIIIETIQQETEAIQDLELKI